MLVQKSEFFQVISELKRSPEFSLDTETTGLYPYQGHRLFSIICATPSESFYFNFQKYDDVPDSAVLSREEMRNGFNDLLSDEELLVFLANAKYDLHILHVDGVKFKARPWDVLSIDKTLNNTFMNYSLEGVAARRGFKKDDTVGEYVKKHKCLYSEVPSGLIIPYGLRDGEITTGIGLQQKKEVELIDAEATHKGEPSFWSVVNREIETTKVCFEIEREGMVLDKDFVTRSRANEETRLAHCRKRFFDLTGRELVDSNKSLDEAFSSIGIQGGRTALGNPSYSKATLKKINHELARLIEDFRRANKRLSSYYESFLNYAAVGNVVHPNIHQTGAKTFRFSVTDPALQTLEKPDDDEPVEALDEEMRNSFRAREGHFLVAIDYKQQEYRLTADYAGEMELIAKIMNGADVHTATAEMMGVLRQAAKTLNFMLLYGGGVAKLCMALMKPICSEIQLKALTKKYIYQTRFDLGPEDPKERTRKQQQHREQWEALATITDAMKDHDLPLLKEAHELQKKYFTSLPKVKGLIDRVQKGYYKKGYIYNWAGRRLRVHSPDFAYKLPNHLIQSSGAEIMRCALIELRKFLADKKTKILLSIHDEILFEMPQEEFHIIPEIQRIMVSVYKPFNGCFMDTDVKWGTAWGSLQKGVPNAA